MSRDTGITARSSATWSRVESPSQSFRRIPVPTTCKSAFTTDGLTPPRQRPRRRPTRRESKHVGSKRRSQKPPRPRLGVGRRKPGAGEHRLSQVHPDRTDHGPDQTPGFSSWQGRRSSRSRYIRDPNKMKTPHPAFGHPLPAGAREQMSRPELFPCRGPREPVVALAPTGRGMG